MDCIVHGIKKSGTRATFTLLQQIFLLSGKERGCLPGRDPSPGEEEPPHTRDAPKVLAGQGEELSHSRWGGGGLLHAGESGPPPQGKVSSLPQGRAHPSPGAGGPPPTGQAPAGSGLCRLGPSWPLGPLEALPPRPNAPGAAITPVRRQVRGKAPRAGRGSAWRRRGRTPAPPAETAARCGLQEQRGTGSQGVTPRRRVVYSSRGGGGPLLRGG